MSEAIQDPLLRIPPPKREALAHIPGDFGLPFVGKTFDWIKDVFALADSFQERYGPVAKTNVLANDLVLAVGAENLRTLYLNSQELISARLTPSSPLSPFYPGALLFTDGADHRGKRRFMQHAFKSEAMRGYVPRIDQIAAKHIANFPTESAEPIFPKMKRFLTEVAATIFFGLEADDPMAATLMDDFVVMNKGLLTLIKTELPIPGLRFPKAMQANNRIESYMRSVINERRHGEGADILSHLCRAKDEDGEWMSDEDIIRQAKFLFFAAHDTTASTLTNMMMFTGIHQSWQTAMRQEIVDVIGEGDIEYAHLDALANTQNVFLETLRIYPAVATTPRIALKGCVLSGLEIPEGTVIMIVTRTTHMSPDHWTNPTNFDPDRFAEGREEHKAHPFQFVPFGGGAHKCIGLHFASMVAKIFYSRLLREYRYALPADYPIKISVLPLPKPADDLPIRFDKL